MHKFLMIACFMGISYIGFGQNDEQPKIPAAMEPFYYKSPGAPMPPLKLLVGDKLITSKDVKNKANLFLMIYNPLCDHCQNQTKNIIDKRDALKKSYFLLVTPAEMKQYASDFEKATGVSKYPALQMAYDSSKLIEKLNNYLGLPQVNIYDHDRKLIKVLNSDFPIDSLVKYME
jgi:hypothetical protein